VGTVLEYRMLVVRDLVKVYPGPVAALQSVALDIDNGMFGLLGQNGAGKSTLMKILAGVLEPTSGSITLDGGRRPRGSARARDTSRLPAARVRLLSAPERRGHAGLPVAPEGSPRAVGTLALARELLARVNLTDAAKRKVKGYSGGMRQRLGIAQALAGDPRLIIVDEPTAGLDPEERQRFYRLLAELATERIVLLSTHIVEDVAVLCPRFAVIRKGRIVAQTSPSAALDALKGRIAEGRPAATESDALRTRYVVTQSLPFEGRARMRLYCPDATPPEGFALTQPTLEDAYFLMMHRTDDALSAAANGGVAVA
jgi:ABC-2 type transport system ATP-binding protein